MANDEIRYDQGGLQNAVDTLLTNIDELKSYKALCEGDLEELRLRWVTQGGIATEDKITSFLGGDVQGFINQMDVQKDNLVSALKEAGLIDAA